MKFSTCTAPLLSFSLSLLSLAACDVVDDPSTADEEALESSDGEPDEPDARGGDDDTEFRAFALGPVYEVRNASNDLCMDIPWGSASATVANQYPCHGGPAQRFRFESYAAGLVTVRNIGSGECITAGGWTGSGYGVAQTTCNPGVFPQAFTVQTIASHPDGATVTLQSSYGGGCLQVPATTAAPTQLLLQPCDGGSDQRWRLTEHEDGSCMGLCGQMSWGCWCDDLCTGYGDCCPDYGSTCG